MCRSGSSLTPAGNQFGIFQRIVKAGLTSAIVHSSKILPQNKINPEHWQWALDLIYDRPRADYHPLGLL